MNSAEALSSDGAAEVKNEEKARPRPRTSKKQEKLAFRGLGRAENRKKWLSEASDKQETR